MKNKEFADILLRAFDAEIIKKLIFSRPRSGEISKISARLVAHRGRKMMALEYSLPGNTVSHKNLGREELEGEISAILDGYSQANLLTTLGDVEWKISNKGKCALLGADKLQRKLDGDAPSFEKAIEALDNKKNYILRGDEDFLIRLGVSDKSGRVHDKRQGKFRQINRFLEHIDDIYTKLPAEGELTVYDLCCGKSYLSFAVYYFLHILKGRRVSMLGIDLKRDVIDWCSLTARELGYNGMRFVYDDVRNTPKGVRPDMVISLHACDVATDIVINSAAELGARVILSTPCCHRYLNDKIAARELLFVTEHPHLKNKLCEALTDALRLSRLKSLGYDVSALELTDPDDTPKNTLIRAIRRERVGAGELDSLRAEYDRLVGFVLGDGKDNYLKGI
ncbi:MAG: SAM-dependent methyltransferase [Clostridia bacterium]|nr:SAM-dependent methyltransferase [Clostridia bacterium]